MSSLHPRQLRQGFIMLSLSLAWILACLAGEQTLTMRDYTGRGFPPDLVEYHLHGLTNAHDQLRLFGADGKQIPCQVVPAPEKGETLLQFVTALPANGTQTYTVRTAGGKHASGSVQAEMAGKELVLRNALLAIRVPGEVNKTFKMPVTAASLPAPILAFSPSPGHWLGQSGILTQKLVKSLRIKLVTRGSVCAEVAYEIRWAEGGYYRATLQVIDQVPLVKVREEYDMNILDGTQCWELDLGHGWRPDHVQTASHHGNGAGDPTGRIVDFPTLVGQDGVQYLVCDQAWGKLSHIGIFNDAESKANPQGYALVGVVPLRKGLWRRSNSLEVRSVNANDLRVRFPMSARNADWVRDITSETSPFSTQEHDPGLPKTYGRRVWGLTLGLPAIPDPTGSRPTYQLQCLYGVIGLNRYKDFILDWPDTHLIYPRLYPSPLPVTAVDTAKCLSNLRTLCNEYFTTNCVSHHQTATNYNDAAQSDAVLAQPGLSEETRREIRARLALLTYAYEDADTMGYGNGHHQGNPNMGTARFWSGPTFMALLPDHPMFPAWREHMAQYGAYNIGKQVAPGGGYLEFGAAYHMHGFSRTTNGLPGLQSAGMNTDKLLKNYIAPDWQYYMNLLTPYDPRWRSRMIPGMANSQPGNTENFIEAAGTLAKYDPKLAANLVWAWKENGAKNDYNHALAPTTIAPVEPALTSQIYPGVGVIFRAHQGPQETYMLLRCGFQWSHWTVDPGHMVLFSKGAPLLPYQPFQYGDSADPTFDTQNTIRFGDPTNIWPHSWGDSTILDHAFGPTVDYAWASTGFPDWFIKPGAAPTWHNAAFVNTASERKLDKTFPQTTGAFTWNRQVLFLKGKTAMSPNYFVIRDSMPGEGKLSSYLYVSLLGAKQDITTDGGHITAMTEWPTKLDMLFTQPTTVVPEMSEQRFSIALHNANLGERVGAPGTISHNWVKKDGAPWEGKPVPGSPIFENHVIVRIPGAPGAGYFWVLYPRSADEPAPQVSVLADGVMKITHPEGTDYVFLGASPVHYDTDGIVFHGLAGAVRLTDTSVTLVKANGKGSVGYKGHILHGEASCEQRIDLVKLAAGDEQIAAPTSPIPFPIVTATEKEVAPGVQRATLENGTIRYRLQHTTMTHYQDGQVRLEGDSAMVEIAPDGKTVRFIAAPDCYVKLSVGNRGIRGVGPFDLTFTPTGISGTVAGDTRSLVTTWPEGIVRPMFCMDGDRYCAGWADDHCMSKGTDIPEFSIGFGVTAGMHTVELKEATYPALPPEN